MPRTIIINPIILFVVKLIFWESNSPQKSIKAAVASWATKIIAIEWVGPRNLMPCITVTVMIIPKIPPKRYNFLQQPMFCKVFFFAEKS